MFYRNISKSGDGKKILIIFLEYWFNYGNINSELVSIVNKLKEGGVKTILGTNNEKYRMEYIKKKFNLENLFDFIIVSCDIGYVKPEKEFCDKIIELTELNPEEILIYNDKEECLIKLKEMGFCVHIYQGVEKFRKEIENEII